MPRQLDCWMKLSPQVGLMKSCLPMLWDLEFRIFIFQFLVDLITGKSVLAESMKQVTNVSQWWRSRYTQGDGKTESFHFHLSAAWCEIRMMRFTMCLSCPVIWISRPQIRVVQPTREVNFTLTYNNDLDFPERGLWPCVYVLRWDEAKYEAVWKLRLPTRWVHFASLGCVVRAPHTFLPEITFQGNEIVLRDLVFQ